MACIDDLLAANARIEALELREVEIDAQVADFNRRVSALQDDLEERERVIGDCLAKLHATLAACRESHGSSLSREEWADIVRGLTAPPDPREGTDEPASGPSPEDEAGGEAPPARPSSYRVSREDFARGVWRRWFGAPDGGGARGDRPPPTEPPGREPAG